jgi:hypothetical protein
MFTGVYRLLQLLENPVYNFTVRLMGPTNHFFVRHGVGVALTAKDADA